MIELKKAYCLNLKRRPQKRQRMSERFKRLGMTVEFIDAVDGEKAARVKGFTPGQAGVVYSFINFLKSKLNTKEEYLFFCEDDIVFCMDFHRRFKKFYERTPANWDMIYLGWYLNAGGKVNRVSENVFKLIYQQGCFCFIMKSHLIPVVLEEMKKFQQVADNVFGWKIQPKFNCYGYKPFFIFVEPGMSDTHGRNMTYTGIKNSFKLTQ